MNALTRLLVIGFFGGAGMVLTWAAWRISELNGSMLRVAGLTSEERLPLILSLAWGCYGTALLWVLLWALPMGQPLIHFSRVGVITAWGPAVILSTRFWVQIVRRVERFTRDAPR